MDRYLRHVEFITNLLPPNLYDKIIGVVTTHKDPAVCLCLYIVCHPVGTGTFGRVILVRDVPTGKYYALKVMNISEVIKLRQVQHVNSEKEILASISHPFIVNL